MPGLHDSGLGGGADADAFAEALGDLDALPIGSSDDPRAFAGAVVAYLQRWLEGRSPDEIRAAPPAAFLFTERPARMAEQLGGFSFHELFEDDVTTEICGRMYLAPAGLDDVHWRESDGADLTSVTRAIRELGLEQCCTVVFQPRATRVLIYWEGIAKRRVRTEVPIGSRRVVSPESVLEMLRGYYERHLRIPSAQSCEPVWSESTRFIPAPRPEKAIHGPLMVYAKARFECAVLREVGTEGGRSDLLILPKENQPGQGCVVELKVLRSFHHCARGGAPRAYPDVENAQAVADGLDQADVYREQFHISVAVLCCYDMRRHPAPDVVGQMRDTAERMDVRIEEYRIYNSAEAYRRDRPQSAARALAALRAQGDDADE
jgi:hypothetical protein